MSSLHDAHVAGEDPLEDPFRQGLGLAGAGQVLGRAVPHLVRRFAAAHGVSPHGHLIGRLRPSSRRHY